MPPAHMRRGSWLHFLVRGPGNPEHRSQYQQIATAIPHSSSSRVGDAVHCVGTPHKPPVLSDSGYCTFESIACADYLMAQNVPAQQLLRETSSFDTIGNGYFAATIHAVPRRWRQLMVVTSDFHMPRSQAIFQKVFELVESDLGIRFVSGTR